MSTRIKAIVKATKARSKRIIANVGMTRSKDRKLQAQHVRESQAILKASGHGNVLSKQQRTKYGVLTLGLRKKK